jgi:hypothetical protein
MEGTKVSEERMDHDMTPELLPEEVADLESPQSELPPPVMNISSEKVEVVQSSAHAVTAQEVTLFQSASQIMNAGHVEASMSAIAQATSQELDMNYGAAGMVKTGNAHLKASSAGIVMADDGVNMDLSRSQAILTRGNVLMEQSMAGVVVARKVKAEKSNIIFLVSGKVEGDVKPFFGPRESLLFGIMAGIVGGILVLTGHLFKGLRNPPGKKTAKQIELDQD